FQANSAATGAAALLWLASRKRFYGSMELKLTGSPMLAGQVLLGILGNAPVLGVALGVLFVAPDPGTTMLTWLAGIGEGGGWLGPFLAFPAEQIQRWVNAIGWLVVVLALRGAGVQVGGAFWSPAAALTVAVMAIGMALWARKPGYVYQSGLLFMLVGNLVLLA